MEILAQNLGLPFLLVKSVVMVLIALGVVSFAAVVGGVLSWVERRLAARFQNRIGPNRVGPQGLLQWLADGIKLIIKEEIVPKGIDGTLFKMAPFLCLMGVIGTFVVLPWGNTIIADLNVGILYMLSITSLVVIGILMAGWASNNKWALLGGMRSAAQIVSYEIPVALSLLPVILISGGLSVGSMIEVQGWAPWEWTMFHSPFTFVSFLIFLVGSLAEGNRIPFDLPEAESELVAGFFTEYSSFRFAIFTLAEFANVYIIGAIMAAVYMGAGNLPDALGANGFLAFAVFFVKVCMIMFVVIWFRWTLPRFRIDQLMDFSWKYLMPAALLAFFGEAVYQLITWDMPALQSIVALTVFLGFLAVCFIFFKRVMINFTEQSGGLFVTSTGESKA